MKYLLPILMVASHTYGQALTTDIFTEKRWIMNTSINLPAAKFHLAEKNQIDDPSGYLELFSSFGVGLGFNYGNATFRYNIDNNKILENETEFTNIVGAQFGILYSSNLTEGEDGVMNHFSLHGGINILNLQLGAGYELGTQFKNSTGWFFSVAYGIPLYKLTRGGYFMFEKKEGKKEKLEQDDGFKMATCRASTKSY